MQPERCSAARERGCLQALDQAASTLLMVFSICNFEQPRNPTSATAQISSEPARKVADLRLLTPLRWDYGCNCINGFLFPL